VRQLVDVDAAGGDVGRHQHLQRALLEVAERLGARALALVAVDRHGGDALVVQELREPVGAVLHAAEHQHLVPVLALDEVRQQVLLAVAVDRMDLLRDRLGRRVAARDFDQLRVVQQPVGEALDLVAEGGAEQQALLVLRHDGQHLLDVVDEAHVEHAVGLVEHEDLDAADVHVPCWWWSSRRPGVATRMSTPRLRRSICGCMPTPPNITIEVSRVCLP
jgi:hypothetical protein